MAAHDKAVHLYAYPMSLSAQTMESAMERERAFLSLNGVMQDTHLLRGAGFVGVDGITSLDDAALLQRAVNRWVRWSVWNAKPRGRT